MSEPRDSITALGVAFMRAAHQILDAAPRTLDDPAALAVLGPTARQLIIDGTAHYQTPDFLALRSQVVLRSRYTEDRLEAAVGRGVSQYVILARVSIPSPCASRAPDHRGRPRRHPGAETIGPGRRRQPLCRRRGALRWRECGWLRS